MQKSISYSKKIQRLRGYGIEGLPKNAKNLTRGQRQKISQNFNRLERILGIIKRDKEDERYQFTLKKVKIGKKKGFSRVGSRIGGFVFVPAHKRSRVRLSGGVIRISGERLHEGIYYFTKAEQESDPREVYEKAKRATVSKGSRFLHSRSILRGGWQGDTRYEGTQGLKYFVQGNPQGFDKKGSAYKDWSEFRRDQVVGIKFTWEKKRRKRK